MLLSLQEGACCAAHCSVLLGCWRAHPGVAAVCAPCVRAGKETINTLYGTRVAVLAGDFLFAQSSWLIANLENMEVGSSGGGCAMPWRSRLVPPYQYSGYATAPHQGCVYL